jgi:flavodoxin
MGNWKVLTVLTVYFSHSGNTQQCAQEIHEQVGGDIFEIVPATPYPQDYNTVWSRRSGSCNRGIGRL